jgi:para-nitrobenzyl esterase
VPPQLVSGRLSDTPPGAATAEDCLFLNIWAPISDRHGEPRLPVMVWIHGGAYMDGSGSQPEYDGARLASDGEVLVVTFDYRLGALGHMDFSGFSSGEHVFESNLALRDQVAALRWVRDNIGAFGGDAERVTVFGESAGGNAVTTLLVTPAAKGLFAAAISESSHPTTAHDASRKKSQAVELQKLLNISDDDIAARLRTISADELVAAGSRLEDTVARREPGVLVMSPTMDGDYLPSYPLDAFRAGESHAVPLLIGTNRDEATIFRRNRLSMMPTTRKAIVRMVTQTDPAALDRILDSYPRPRLKRTWLDMSTDGIFRVPAIEIAEMQAERAATWMYRFDAASPFFRILGLRATHASEVPFVFGNFATPSARRITRWMKETTRSRLLRQMMGYWTTFAHLHRPVDEEQWPLYVRETRITLIVGKAARLARDPQAAGRRAWTGVRRHR